MTAEHALSAELGEKGTTFYARLSKDLCLNLATKFARNA
jgi:hypothetical protein